MRNFSICATVFSAGVALVGFAPATFAQQMDHSNMPGMNMPSSSAQPSRTPAASPQQSGTGAAANSGAPRTSKSASTANSAAGSRKVTSEATTQARVARPDRN